MITNKLNSLIAQSNIYTNDSDSEFDQPISCSYYSCEDCIKKHIEELRILLTALSYKFDIIAISESKLKGEPNMDISIKGYQQPYCAYTTADKGGTILYV